MNRHANLRALDVLPLVYPPEHKQKFKTVFLQHPEVTKNYLVGTSSFNFQHLAKYEIKQIGHQATQLETGMQIGTYADPFCGYFNCAILFFAFFNHRVQVGAL